MLLRAVRWVVRWVYRGHGMGGLIRYLYGPERAESPVAHHDPHLVASWLGRTPAPWRLSSPFR